MVLISFNMPGCHIFSISLATMPSHHGLYLPLVHIGLNRLTVIPSSRRSSEWLFPVFRKPLNNCSGPPVVCESNLCVRDSGQGISGFETGQFVNTLELSLNCPCVAYYNRWNVTACIYLTFSHQRHQEHRAVS